jgi:hypothetical protein
VHIFALVAQLALAVVLGNCDRDLLSMDIKSDILMDLHVLVLDFGCFGSRLTHADRLPSPGATRVVGDKHTFFPPLGTQS